VLLHCLQVFDLEMLEWQGQAVGVYSQILRGQHQARADEEAALATPFWP
jgi:hypothetical protein